MIFYHFKIISIKSSSFLSPDWLNFYLNDCLTYLWALSIEFMADISKKLFENAIFLFS